MVSRGKAIALSKRGRLRRHRSNRMNEEALMCPACLAAAAIAAAKVASTGGLTAYGVKKLLAKSKADAESATPNPGDQNETAEHHNA